MRFLGRTISFFGESLNQPVGRFPGVNGPACYRTIDASPADLLPADEPTNDLDIPHWSFWKRAGRNTRGAGVGHTRRFMLARVSTVVWGSMQGSAEHFADYAQWEAWQRLRAVQSCS